MIGLADRIGNLIAVGLLILGIAYLLAHVLVANGVACPTSG